MHGYKIVNQNHIHFITPTGDFGDIYKTQGGGFGRGGANFWRQLILQGLM